MHPMTIRLPDDLYEKLREQAHHQRTTINALITECIIRSEILV